MLAGGGAKDSPSKSLSAIAPGPKGSAKKPQPRAKAQFQLRDLSVPQAVNL